MDKPLVGLKVVELARILAGPWAGQLLADLGAEVIKVERPGGGDDTRAWGPPFAADGSAAYFHGCNRGKSSVAIDLATAEGQERVRALVRRRRRADREFQGRRPRQIRARLSPASPTLNPRLIYCSITGFGQDGPYAARPGYDFMIQGMGGMMDLTGEPDGEPMRAGVAVADLFTGLYASSAILAALRGREATGAGCHIDMALLDVQVAMLANQAMNYLIGGEAPRRLGNAHPNIAPYQTFAVADGHVIVAVGNDGQFARLCALLGVAADARFATNAGRVGHRDALTALLSPAIALAPPRRIARRPGRRRHSRRPDQRRRPGLRRSAGDRARHAHRPGGVPGIASPIVIDGTQAGRRPAQPGRLED